ncbi:MAG: META domain-containing protein [Alphaproteobacteria bacterium]|jgi:heat shock protein HslJ|nr:META domain-containing protein [Alphaproteobacteria bacterium]
MKKISALLLFLFLASCVLIAPNQKDKLINRDLTLVVDNRLPQKNLPFILIKADGRVSGSTGCNRIVGTAAFGNTGEVIFRNIAITRMLCIQESSNDLEQYFVDGLNNTLFYFINEDTVYFLDKNQDKIFALKIRE